MKEFIEEIDDIIKDLGNRQHLVRVKAQSSLKDGLENKSWALDENIMEAMTAKIKALMASNVAEEKLGGLIACPTILPHANNMEDFVIERCKQCLEDPEVRVRMAIGDVLGEMAQGRGIQVFDKIGDTLLESINANFERDSQSEGPEVESGELLDNLLEASYKPAVPGTGDLRHGTEGWKCLETSFRAVAKIIEACGPEFQLRLSSGLMDLIFKGTQHLNRFVREICFLGIGSFCGQLDQPNIVKYSKDIVTALARGLSDDWSQVRYAASKSTRSLMLLLDEATRKNLFSLILPQMCLNRYYVAEGVRVYSQETWRMVVKDKGCIYVGILAPHFVEYYIRQCGANNHAVREAACACIAELMAKVESGCIREFVPRLLNALVNCFKDASWPVRDAACEACGNCAIAFPEESRAVLSELYELWFAHLWDNIRSVRENSAVALGNVVRAYGNEAVEKILPVLRDLITSASDQPPDSTQFSSLENSTLFGVARIRDQVSDAAIFTDQQMFSCGSLAPKLARGGGCMDHGFSREKEPWEASDGSVYLVRELALVEPNTCIEFLPALAKLSETTGFAHAHNLRESVWKCLPEVASSLGKRAFKPHLELFIGPLFKSVRCGQQLEEVAAGRAIEKLMNLIGPSIFKGRLDSMQKEILDSSQHVSAPNGYLIRKDLTSGTNQSFLKNDLDRRTMVRVQQRSRHASRK